MPRLSNCRFLLAAILILACGKADQSRSWKGGDDTFNLDQNKAAAGLAGEWHGGLKDKRDDAPTLLMPVTVVLNTDKTFIITLDDVPSAGAAGTFIQFQDTILFTIKKSALSVFGLSGAQRDLSYSLFGKTLTMFDKQIEFKLEAGKSAQPQGQGDIPDADPLLGNWQGQDKKGNDWYLALATGHVFTARVENATSNPLHLEGSIAIVADSDPERANLLTTKTNNPAVEAMTISVEYAPATKKLRVTIYKSGADDRAEEVQSFLMTKL